ncbi:MAG: MFS transporter [Candidatus Electryonea clarkiae]|nr:MFS transporter [Candidatus Electryonea clarkiae]MDP8285352.1 MFS transporter [Candidatus Electryonea clarkiae]
MATEVDSSEGKIKRSKFPPTFYVANVMEIFERLAWYGFFALAALYITSPVRQGGLGFNEIQRGMLMGVIPFLLYLFPVITGALADRYGYRRTFLVAFGIMTPSYFLLGQMHNFWSFFGVFLLLAVGAATFKPVVVGTVGRTTDDTNRGLGFGVFYTIVNVGGFIGPIVAGYVRVISWDLVFLMSAIWIGINFIPTIFFYKEPTSESTSEEKRTLKAVLTDAQEVLGNGRFALAVAPVVVLFMLAGGGWVGWWWSLGGSIAWVFLNLILNGRLSLILMIPYLMALFGLSGNNFNMSALMPLIIISAIWIVLFGFLSFRKSSAELTEDPWHKLKPKIGNWPFVLYIVIFSGFWTSFNQIFITMPGFIRDFVDTADLIRFFSMFGDNFIHFLAAVNIEQLTEELGRLLNEYGVIANPETAHEVFMQLVHYKVRVPEEVIMAAFQSLQASGMTDPAAVTALANEWADKYRQVNPEYIINIDAGSIVVFQILVSSIIDRWKTFPVLIAGTIVASIGIAIGGLAHGIALGGFFVLFAIIVFAFGEMIASPKSQEYVARIAPKKKTALFMGYYFVSFALGNLFGGILSGWGYQKIALDMNRPILMWVVFGLVGFITPVALLWFNKAVVPMLEAQRETNNE